MADGDARIVVIAMDGSEHADNAFAWYVDNVRRAKDHVILVHCPEYHAAFHAPVVGVGMVAVEVNIAEKVKEETTRVHALLARLEDRLKEAGVAGTVKSVHGKPGEGVVRVAEEADAALIVTGTRGVGVIRRTLMGSVSDYILHHSHVPVIICRHPKHLHAKGK